MTFSQQPQLFLIFLSIFFVHFTSLPSTLSLRIDNCSTVLGNNLPDTIYNVKIDAEIDWTSHNVGSVKKMKFFVSEFKHHAVNNFTIDVTSLKTVRVQRMIRYKSQGFQDIVEPYCTLNFIYDYDTSSKIPYGLGDDIISHAENCIERALCNFDPEDHKMGDDIYVIPTTRHEILKTTSQVTINSLIDVITNIYQDSLIDKTKSVIPIPMFEVSAYKIKFSSSGGIVDISKYIQRDADLSFQYEGHRYIVETALRLIGGHVELNNLTISSWFGDILKGQLPINTTGSTLRLRIVLDYNQTPCKISVADVALNVPPEQIDLSVLKIKAFGFEIVNVEKFLNTLSLKKQTVSMVNKKLKSLLTETLEGLDCEGYRELLFNAKKNL